MMRSPQTRRAGFTLVELMISLIAGAIAVAGIYYLSGVSSRMFAEQMRVTDTQMSLRAAMEQVRRDFGRAGYLATPNSKTLPDCDGNRPGVGVVPTDRWVRALSIKKDGSTDSASDPNTLLGSPGTNKTRYDAVTLWGNYATADAYLTDPRTTSSSLITFQVDSESFRRSFFDPAQKKEDPATYSPTRFESAFTGRMLRVEHEGRVFFRDIKTVNSAMPNPTLELATSLPPCFDPTRWSAVAPVMRVRYALETDGKRNDMKRLKAVTPVGSPASYGDNRTILVRRELDPTVVDDTEIAGRSRVILDYAVEFGVDAILANVGSPSWSYALDKTALDAASDAPENIRAVVVTLSSRSAEADPRLPGLARAPFGDATLFNGPLLTFQVIDPDMPETYKTWARVRTLRSEIFLQNQ